MNYSRNRLIYIIIIIIVITLGLASRHYQQLLPDWIAIYLGDVLWGLMVYFIMALLFARRKIRYICLIALLFSMAIEISQLYHAPWIDAIRSYRLGGLILGYGFLWSDILCYAVGIAFGALLEWVFLFHKGYRGD